ncbi:RHS repeat domain-containing protein, partial [Duganella sp. Root336D2]|uniref:RHS repeat domain-containing protein n=1 Tax=Duganella sp. Root336D2 TaxID=1736518 RepID=UPI0006F41C7B
MGNLVKTADPNLNVTKFEYDAADRKINSIDGEGKQTDYRYDGVGNLVGQTDPNGNEISHTYDKL